MAKNKDITIQAEIDAPIEKVWKLYTKPEHIIHWNNASDDWHTTSAKNDLKVGGKFNSRMEAKDKSVGFDFKGMYTKVETNKLIAYTLDDERKVEVIFSEDNKKTKIKLVFEAELMNSVELQRDGWQSILNNFKKYVEAN